MANIHYVILRSLGSWRSHNLSLNGRIWWLYFVNRKHWFSESCYNCAFNVWLGAELKVVINHPPLGGLMAGCSMDDDGLGMTILHTQISGLGSCKVLATIHTPFNVWMGPSYYGGKCMACHHALVYPWIMLCDIIL